MNDRSCDLPDPQPGHVGECNKINESLQSTDCNFFQTMQRDLNVNCVDG